MYKYIAGSFMNPLTQATFQEAINGGSMSVDLKWRENFGKGFSSITTGK
jgi:hypothetical protein